MDVRELDRPYWSRNLMGKSDRKKCLVENSLDQFTNFSIIYQFLKTYFLIIYQFLEPNFWSPILTITNVTGRFLVRLACFLARIYASWCGRVPQMLHKKVFKIYTFKQVLGALKLIIYELQRLSKNPCLPKTLSKLASYSPKKLSLSYADKRNCHPSNHYTEKSTKVLHYQLEWISWS